MIKYSADIDFSESLDSPQPLPPCSFPSFYPFIQSLACAPPAAVTNKVVRPETRIRTHSRQHSHTRMRAGNHKLTTSGGEVQLIWAAVQWFSPLPLLHCLFCLLYFTLRFPVFLSLNPSPASPLPHSVLPPSPPSGFCVIYFSLTLINKPVGTSALLNTSTLLSAHSVPASVMSNN